MKKTYIMPRIKGISIMEEALLDQLSNPGGTVDGSQILGKEDIIGDELPKQRNLWDD